MCSVYGISSAQNTHRGGRGWDKWDIFTIFDDRYCERSMLGKGSNGWWGQSFDLVVSLLTKSSVL